MTAVHASSHPAVQVELIDEEVGDETGRVASAQTSDEKLLGRRLGKECAVTASLVFQRLHDRLALVLDVKLTIGDTAPNRPEHSDPAKKEGLTRSIGCVIDEDKHAHLEAGAVWRKGRVT
jgi:hypothetical protein